MALIIDTGVLFGAIDRRDAHHSACRDLLTNYPEQLVVPSPVVVELDWMISRYLDPHLMIGFLDDLLEGVFKIEVLLPVDYSRIRDICNRYADARVGFVDAAVLAVAERQNEPKLATLDRRHFGLLRPRHVDALELLPIL